MEMMTKEEAQSIVDTFGKNGGVPIDVGIKDALVEFTRLGRALGFRTVQSCEGHADWGFPFPWIDFEVDDERIKVPPLWKPWLYFKRRRALQESMRHASNLEEKTTELCMLFTRLLVLHDDEKGMFHDSILVVERRGRFRFRILPARSMLSEACKMAADFQALNRLLDDQRSAMKSVATFCSRQIASEKNFFGIPKEGCRGCMGRG